MIIDIQCHMFVLITSLVAETVQTAILLIRFIARKRTDYRKLNKQHSSIYSFKISTNRTDP